MQRLSPQDAMFAYMESPRTPLHLGWLNIYDPSSAPQGNVSYEAILDHLRARLHTVPLFRQKLVFVPAHLDEPYWIDDQDFELAQHVRLSRLPAPGDWRQLQTLVARLFAQPLNFERPLWEFCVIEGLDNVEGYPTGSFAILAKIHHCAVDGISGVDVSTAIHTVEADTPSPKAAAWEPESAPTTAGLLTRVATDRLGRRGQKLRSLARSLPALRNVKAAMDAGDLEKPTRHKVPATPFSGAVGQHRIFEAERFRIDELRPIRGLVRGATLNDVLLAGIGGALRRFLLAKGELPSLPLTAVCPISLRTDEERGKFGNRIGNMFVGLGTDVADPTERLRGIVGETVNAKRMNEALGLDTLADLNGLLPGAVVSLGTRLAARVTGTGAANTTVTNVQGPKTPLYLAGARLDSQFGLGTLLDGMGIFHFIHSYCGELTLTVTADRAKLSDSAVYAEAMRDSFDELFASVSK